MPESLVHIAGRDAPLTIRINGDRATFQLSSDRLEAQCLQALEPRSKDFMEIAATIFAADGTIPRGGPARDRMGTAWRRGFRFEIPVRDPEFWSDPAIKDLLVDVSGFLTDDDFEFSFHHLVDPGPSQPFLDLDPEGAIFPVADVVLFSGGLDSFSGALEMLSNTDDNILLVSHRSAQKVIPRQERLGEFLAASFPGRVRHLHVQARRHGTEGKDTTQRSRTLLFTALATAVAKAFDARRISFFENGIVSHNLPISPQIVGTMATRTTHPLALDLLVKLVARLGSGKIEVRNPFEWLTKTEVVSRIAENDQGTGARNRIEVAVSCTSVRDQDKLRTHCGTCSQCLDRRFAILAAGLGAFDPPERYAVDVLLGPRETHGARVMAVEWTRHMLRLQDLDARSLLERFGTELSRILVGHGDHSASRVLQMALDLYHRQSEAVRTVLERAAAARLLADDSLQPGSLLGMLLLGDRQNDVMKFADPRMSLEATAVLSDIKELDMIPHPDDPLTVAFLMDANARHVVAARGLCRISGQPARVAHGLKPQFDTDRADGLRREDHRFVEHWRAKVQPQMAADSFRQNVTRCRKELASAFQDLHGVAPEKPLLIEGRQGLGYRLDPTIRLAAAAEIDKS